MFFQRANRKFFGWFLAGGGSICLAIAAGAFLFSWHFVNTAAHADGRILRMLEQNDKDNGKVYYPVFTFRDAQGAEHTIHSSWGSFPPQYEVGDAVPVLYSPGHPENATINRFFAVWGMPLIIGILGAVYLSVGLVVWFWPKIIQTFRKEPPVFASPH